MILFDTSVYIAAFKLDDPHHDEAITLIENCSEQILLLHIILQEVITVLTYKLSLNAGKAFLEFIRNDSRFVLVENNLLQDIAFWESLGKRISVIDASIIAFAVSF